MNKISFIEKVLSEFLSGFSKTFLDNKYSRKSLSSAKRSTDFCENSIIVRKLLKNFLSLNALYQIEGKLASLIILTKFCNTVSGRNDFLNNLINQVQFFEKLKLNSYLNFSDRADRYLRVEILNSAKLLFY